MPSSMTHLQTARKVHPEADVLFLVGSVAPDAVAPWQEKEIRHFRNLHDRTDALEALARATAPVDPFAEGVLLHLFLDWRWDLAVKDAYIARTGPGWFPSYRHELSLSSLHAYHEAPWAPAAWAAMDACDIARYGEVDGATAEEVREYIHHTHHWHRENPREPSTVFTPYLIEDFAEQVAAEYRVWRGRAG